MVVGWSHLALAWPVVNGEIRAMLSTWWLIPLSKGGLFFFGFFSPFFLGIFSRFLVEGRCEEGRKEWREGGKEGSTFGLQLKLHSTF